MKQREFTFKWRFRSRRHHCCLRFRLCCRGAGERKNETAGERWKGRKREPSLHCPSRAWYVLKLQREPQRRRELGNTICTSQGVLGTSSHFLATHKLSQVRDATVAPLHFARSTILTEIIDRLLEIYLSRDQCSFERLSRAEFDWEIRI